MSLVIKIAAPRVSCLSYPWTSLVARQIDACPLVLVFQPDCWRLYQIQITGINRSAPSNNVYKTNWRLSWAGVACACGITLERILTIWVSDTVSEKRLTFLFNAVFHHYLLGWNPTITQHYIASFRCHLWPMWLHKWSLSFWLLILTTQLMLALPLDSKFLQPTSDVSDHHHKSLRWWGKG